MFNFSHTLDMVACLRALVNPSPKSGPTDRDGISLLCREV